MARKFLYVFAFLIVLAIAAMFAYRIWGVQLLRQTMIPKIAFKTQPRAEISAYADAKMWLARPDKPGNPALWVPEGYQPAANPPAAVFFIHPTSYLGTTQWNASLDDAEANSRAALFTRGQASAFNEVGAVWAPRYRQATFGAFLTSTDAANQALDLAYQDILAAFDRFLAEVGPDRPIILAGHSQGSLHLTRLLVDRVAGKPLAKRIVAAYAVGWPISKTADLPKMGLPECARADQANCIVSWQSFAEPADPSLIFDNFDATLGFTGEPRANTPLICTNPLTGNGWDSEAAATATPDAAQAESATANLGTLVPSADLTTATLQVGMVPARCAGRGILLIGNPPQMGPYVLPGNNYHVFDYTLFWANTRADAARRLGVFMTAKAR